MDPRRNPADPRARAAAAAGASAPGASGVSVDPRRAAASGAASAAAGGADAASASSSAAAMVPSTLSGLIETLLAAPTQAHQLVAIQQMYVLLPTAPDAVDALAYLASPTTSPLFNPVAQDKSAGADFAAGAAGAAGTLFAAGDSLVRTALVLFFERAAVDPRHGARLLPVVFPALAAFLVSDAGDSLLVRRVLRTAVHLLRPALCAVAQLSGSAAAAARLRRARRARRLFFASRSDRSDRGQGFSPTTGSAAMTDDNSREADDSVTHEFDGEFPPEARVRARAEAAAAAAAAASPQWLHGPGPALWTGVSSLIMAAVRVAAAPGGEAARAAALKLLEMAVLALGDARAGDSALLHAALAEHRLGTANKPEDVAMWRKPTQARSVAAGALAWGAWQRWTATGLDETHSGGDGDGDGAGSASGATGLAAYDDGGVGTLQGADVPAEGELDDPEKYDADAAAAGRDVGAQYLQLAAQVRDI